MIQMMKQIPTNKVGKIATKKTKMTKKMKKVKNRRRRKRIMIKMMAQKIISKKILKKNYNPQQMTKPLSTKA